MKRIFPLTAVSLCAIACLTLVAVISCDGNEGILSPQQPEDGARVPVGFSTSVGEPTMSRALTTDNLTSMGVFASYTGQDDWNATTSKLNFMYNQQVSRANNSSPWTYTPVKYWPNTTTDKLSFFAYAPYVDESAAGGSTPSFQGNTVDGREHQ